MTSCSMSTSGGCSARSRCSPAVHVRGRRGGRGAWCRAGGAAAGGLLAAEPAAGRTGWPGALCDAGDAARLGTGLLAEAGSRRATAAALAGCALRWRRMLRRTAGRQGELAAARWLDAEDAMMRQALAWAMDHDAPTALRLAVALAHGGTCAAGRGGVPPAARGCQARRCGQRDVVRRAILARPDGARSADLAGALRRASPRSATPSRNGYCPRRWWTAWAS